MSDSASARLWDSASPELRRQLADARVYVPGTEEWIELSRNLLLSTTDHVFFILPLPATTAYRDSLPEFAIEITLVTSTALFFKSLRSNPAKKDSTGKWEIKRTRIFRFDHSPGPDDLSILLGFVDERTPRPFIETFWYDGEIIDISILGLFDVPRVERARRAAILSVGLEMLNGQRDEKKIKTLLAGIMTATLKKGWGGSGRRTRKDFTPELCERFAKKANELRPLWDMILSFFKANDYNSGCVKMVKNHSDFEKLSSACIEVPEDLIKRVFRRQNLGGEEYYPQTFTLLHAKRELGITRHYEISSLHEFYREGNKLVNEASEPKQA